MNRAFTLIELLVVIGIMGLLGTASVGGYRAMQRGMADRGAMQSVNSFIRAAYQRAQIDRQPTAVYCWNETLRQADDYNTEIVVGKAVAIRRYGRITRKEGDRLIDEFADLNYSYATDDATGDSGNAGGEGSGDDNAENTMYLYPIDRLSDLTSSSDLKRSLVYQKVYREDTQLLYLSGDSAGLLTDGDAPPGGQMGVVTAYAFKLHQQGGVEWKAGMAYGLEFARLELPQGYIFGSTYSTDVTSPVRVQGTLVFNIGVNSGSGVSDGVLGRSQIPVSVLLPGSTGELQAKSIGQSDDPREDLK
ncbi:MAG: Tfp pilus assembly protein FimT/FimU [Kiritimatiellia bacterium]